MYIAVDFDGTCVKHKYPNIGEEIGATLVLKELINEGHKIILHTMRSGKELKEAIEWFDDREIPLFGINNNPTQSKWTKSPKVFAHLYIDDAALGCPLVENLDEDRPFVDWDKVKNILISKGLIK